MIKKVIFACVLVLAGHAAAGISVAEAQQQSVCSRDASRLCRRVLSDGDMAVFQCLKANRPKLTAACAALIDQH